MKEILICIKDCYRLVKKTECILSYIYVDLKTINYGIPPGMYEIKCENKAYKESVELEADEKSIKTILTTYHEVS